MSSVTFQRSGIDRRQNNVPVEVDRRSGQDRRNTNLDATMFTALETIPMFRRANSIPDKMQQGDGATALGMASLALINFPEDCRDLRSAARQIQCLMTKEKYDLAYDYIKCQHPFSFFRGTFLKYFANPKKCLFPKLAEKIFHSDKTLAQTIFGEKILSLLKVKRIDAIETKIHAINSTKECPMFVSANIYDGKTFGKLTARALERTTIWGIGAMTLLELPRIIHAINQSEGIDKKAKNGSKQVLKSIINVASITAGIGYMGAIGSRFGGPAGSLIGMGAGAILGGYGSHKLQEQFL